MASGLFAHLGIVDTTGTDGAYDPADVTWLAFNSEGVESNIERIESEAIGRGRNVVSRNGFVVNPKGSEGEVEFEFTGQHAVALLPFMLTQEVVNTTTPVADPAGTSRVIRHRLGGTHREFTLIIARPGYEDTVWTEYSGCVVTEWELSAEVDGLLMASLTVDGRTERNLVGADTPSPVYPAREGALLSYAQVSTAIADLDGNSIDLRFNSLSISATRALKTDRYNLGSTAKREQVQGGGFDEVEVSVEVDFAGINDPAYKAYRSSTPRGTLLRVTGVIGAGTDSVIDFTIPYLRVDSANPTVGGPDFLTLSVDGKALSDETNISPVTLGVTHFEPTA